MLLGVNIDHIATLREARKINDPNPLEAIAYLKNAGAHQITIHLREDRRHIDDSDVEAIVRHSSLPVNVESSINAEILEILCRLKPHSITLVPEKREEVTTEGGLDLKGHQEKIRMAIDTIRHNGIVPALFIDPLVESLPLAQEMGASKVEFHTGRYANLSLMCESNLAYTKHALAEFDYPRERLKTFIEVELQRLQQASLEARRLGFAVAAGHGLNLQNLDSILALKCIEELNIGHSIIGRAVFVGLERAVKEVLEKMQSKI